MIVEPRMQISTRAAASGLLFLACLVLTACGSGNGGNNGPGGGGGPGGGNGPFQSVAGPNGGVIAGLDTVLTLTFSKPVLAGSVDLSAIQIVTVDDATGLSSVPGGIVASVLLETDGSIVRIRPTVTFGPSNVEYGLVGNALYEVSFANAVSGNSLLSTAGDVLENPEQTYFFRTPTKGGDGKPGFPGVRAFFVDDLDAISLPAFIEDADGSGTAQEEAIALLPSPEEILTQTPTLTVPITPVREIAFVFDEAVIPESVINVLDGSSPTIALLFNTVPLPGFAPKTAPGTFELFYQQQTVTIVRWVPSFQAYPPDGFLFVEVTGLVEDLACNSKLSLSGSGDPSLFVGVRVETGLEEEFDPIIEPFTNDANEDGAKTSADWANAFPGLLGPVFGGGAGGDGRLILDDGATPQALGTTEVPLEGVLDVEGRVLWLPTVEQVSNGVFEPRSWEFTSIDIPVSWTVRPLTDRDGDGTPDPEEFIVQSAGHPLDGLGAPLVLRASGDIEIAGGIDVSGVSAAPASRPASDISPSYADYLGQGAPGAESLLAAGNGGRGGDVVVLGDDGQPAFNLIAPAGFQATDTSGLIRGVTGRSSALTATTLTDSEIDLSVLLSDPVLSDALAAGEILLQPNVGIGSQALATAGTDNINIDENHPTFTVTGVSVDAGETTFTVDPTPGSMTQVSDNVGNNFAPIAASGDSYLVGRFKGSRGGDESPLDRGGDGAMPYLVVNATAITTTAGGGGGGGGYLPGEVGGTSGPDEDPFVDQRGSSNGMALGEAGGASGGVGAIIGTARIASDVELDVLSQSAGRDLAELTGTALAGSLLIPNSEFDGWLFEVASFDGTTIVVERIVSDAVDIGLDDGSGATGPGLGLGVNVQFTIIPPLGIGGAGGGGTGTSIPGTLNVLPGNIPNLTPGAAAGAGGGSVVIETASALRISSSARVLARGGDGATIDDGQGTKFAGGGGGGGGNIVLRGGTELSILDGAEISAAGGAGGGLDGFGLGGRGGGGYVRLESADDSLSLALLGDLTDPPLTEANLGRTLGEAQGIARSRFYDSSLANTAYTRVEVDYVADTDSDGITEPFSWSFGQTGRDGGPEGIVDPPFEISFNTVPANDQGFLDTNAIDEIFVSAAELVAARSGLAWDDTDDVLLYARGEGTTEIQRLLPDLTPATPATIPLPFIVSEGSNTFDIVSIAIDDAEIHLLERATGRVIVLDRSGTFLRIVTLPKAVSGAIALDDLGRLLVFDNQFDTFEIYEVVDAGAADPATESFEVDAPVSSLPVVRDGVPVDVEVIGLALAADGTTLWCADGLSSEVFVLTLAGDGSVSSTSGIEASGVLEFDGDGVIPSALAFDGTSLFVVNAADKDETTITSITAASVPTGGAPIVLPAFGPAAPVGGLAVGDGKQFVRFEITLESGASFGATTFDLLRIDEVRIVFENESF